MEKGKTERVFVYGALRKGASNAWRMADAEFVEKASVFGKMLKIDWFPGVVLGGGKCVHGEIYDVSPATMTELDEFEGAHYKRLKTMAESEESGSVEVWIYEWLGGEVNFEEMPGGDWLAGER